MVTLPTSVNELQKAIIAPDMTIEEALKHMDNEVALIVDSEKCLLGIVTDGDIRRAFLSGAELHTAVVEVMTTNAMTICKDMRRENILSLMLLNKIRHLPVLDANGRVIGLELLKNQYDESNLAQAVLMAGGKGTRLHPLTFDTPKPLLKIGDETILDNVMAGLKSSGVNDVVISINYLGDQIKDHVKLASDIEMSVGFVEEKKVLGTAGALSLLTPKPTKSFFVMNADLLTEVDYRAFARFHEKQDNDFSVCVRKVSSPVPFGVVKLTNNSQNIESIVEKPEYDFLVNAGIYMLKPQIIDLIPKNTFFDMVSLIKKAIASGYKVGAFPIVEYWCDIGQHSEMENAKKEKRVKPQAQEA